MQKKKTLSAIVRGIKPGKDSQKIIGSKVAFITILKKAVKTEPFDKKG